MSAGDSQERQQAKKNEEKALGGRAPAKKTATKKRATTDVGATREQNTQSSTSENEEDGREAEGSATSQPKKKQRKVSSKEQERPSETAVRASKGKIAGYEKGKEYGVEGFGCVHCSFKQMKGDQGNQILTKGYLEKNRKEGEPLYQTKCGGENCTFYGEDLDFNKHKNKVTKVVAYYCRYNILFDSESKEKEMFVEGHCPWYCWKCMDAKCEEEDTARMELEGGQEAGGPKRSTRRSTRGSG